MIQDRIGRNRAVIYLPGWLFKFLSLALGFGPAGAVGPYALLAMKRPESVRLDAGFGLTELAVFLGWFGLVVLRRQALRKGQTRGLGGSLAKIADARVIFYCGLAAHVAVAAARISVGAGEPGHLGGIFQFGSAVAVLLLAAAGVLGFTRVPTRKGGGRLGGTV